jgi:hypothetical protein
MYKYSGRTWSSQDIDCIRGIISGAPSARRSELARLVCEAFDWRRHDGELKEMSSRMAMLRMQRDGVIELPTPRCVCRAPRRDFASERSDRQAERTLAIADLDLKVELVTRGESLTLWNEFIGRYHYLGYTRIVGAQVRYFITDGKDVLGALGFGGAAWKVACRDEFLGWSSAEREKQLHLVVNQTRFLILPWVRCQNLATKSLAMAAKRLASDWLKLYGYRPVLMETFVDTTRYQGTCYKAGNWACVGMTKGRSKYDKFHQNASPVKSVWLMPLMKNYRAALLGQSAGGMK